MVTARLCTSSTIAPARFAAFALALGLLVAHAGLAGATVFNVPGDQPAIQVAIGLAADGDTIIVAPGTYTGALNRDLNFGGKNLILQSSGGPAVTIIDCEQSGRGIILTHHETTASRIVGFTIQNAFADSEAGGVLLQDSGATFVNCVFHANHGDTGGGIWCNRSTVVIIDCVFSDNLGEGNSFLANYGGGLWIDRGSTGTVTNTRFERNRSKHGAGLWVGGSAHVQVVDCTFTDNEALSRGGGIGAGGAPTVLTVTGSTFTGNTASSNGGGASLIELDPEFHDCVFSDNTSGSRGGGMFLSQSDAIISGTLFNGNTADEDGGGISCLLSAPHVESSTFYGNSALAGGGLLVGGNGGSSAATIERTIIAFGTSGEAIACEAGSSADLSCTDIIGNAGGDWIGCIASELGQDGNFSLDPMFCDAAGGDFRVAANGPCAPANSPPGCNLIGAFPAECAAAGIAGATAPAVGFLLQVTPNPMVSGGTIEWTSASAAPTVLRLYDAAGRLAAEHDLGRVGAGRSALAWEQAFPGTRLGSGVYFLRGESGAKVAPAVRIVIMR